MAVFLLLVSAILAACAFNALHLPAAWLFGPLLVSVFFAIRGWNTIKFSTSAACVIRAVIGTAMGARFSGETLHLLFDHLGMVITTILLTLIAAVLNGWILVRWTKLDPATALLGTLPGGASAMITMSESLRADTRLVAVMQYIRLLTVLGTLFIAVPLLMHLFPHTSQVSHTLHPISTNLTAFHIGMLLFLTAAGYFAGLYTRIPAAPFLIPSLLEFVLGLVGIYPGRWPALIFMTAYLLMGLQVGSNFKYETLAMLKGLFIPVFSTTFFLLIISFFLAAWLAFGLKLAPLDAYLAATPGGLDSVAAMAGELGADSSIILVIQVARLLSVLILGPWLIRGCIGWLNSKKKFF